MSRREVKPVKEADAVEFQMLRDPIQILFSTLYHSSGPVMIPEIPRSVNAVGAARRQLTFERRLAIVTLGIPHAFESSAAILEVIAVRNDVFQVNLTPGYQVHSEVIVTSSISTVV